MKSVRIHQTGDPEVMQIEELPIPTPAEHQVVVKVMSYGINPVETYIRSGKNGRGPPSLPWTPGQDAAGEVHSIGPGVDHLKVGDRVYTIASISGTYAQYTLCHFSSVLPLPDTLTYDQGASLHIPYFTAYHAIHHIGKAKQGDVIFIHGCSGATGTAALQFAKAAGHIVIGSAGTTQGLRQIEAQGADLAINHREENYMQSVLDFTKGQGVDVIIEMLANVNLGKDLPILAKNGRVVVVGSRGGVEVDPRELMLRRASVHGLLLSNATDEEIFEIIEAVNQGMQSGVLQPIVYLVLPGDKVAEAHRQVISPSAGALGKIVVRPWE